MASRERPRGTGQEQSVFDQRTFAEAVGITANAIAQASIACRQEDPSYPQRFRAYHPPTFTGGKDSMVDDHWFMQIERVLEAMEITSDATQIRLAAFQLEDEAYICGGNGQGHLETLEEPLYVNSPLGIRARIGMIC